MTPSDNSQWYARRNGTVRGPFTDEDIARYLLLGRIRLEDELSQDRLGWRPAREYPERFPEELLRPSSWEDYQKLLLARMKVDERVGQRRESRGKIRWSSRKERRRLADRRRFASDAEFLQYPVSDPIPRNPQGPDKRQSQPWRTLLLGMLLVTLVFAFFSISAR